MYDLNSYLAQMSSGLMTHKKLEEARYGSKKKRWIKLWQAPKVQPPLFEIKEDDLP